MGPGARHRAPLMGDGIVGRGSLCAQFHRHPSCSPIFISLAVGAVQKFVIRSLKRGNGGGCGGALHAPVLAWCGQARGGHQGSPFPVLCV